VVVRPAGEPVATGAGGGEQAAPLRRDVPSDDGLERAEGILGLVHGPRVRSAEGVDRLVRVADDDEFLHTGGQQAQQLDLCRVYVLVLVDEQVPASAALGLEQPGSARNVRMAAWINFRGIERARRCADETSRYC
jgi:hypothetical protein